jgi:hypothetical protein
MPIDRRDAVKGLALSALAPIGAAGCSGSGYIRVAVVWSGWELAGFRRVIESYREGARGGRAMGPDGPAPAGRMDPRTARRAGEGAPSGPGLPLTGTPGYGREP